MCRRLIMWSRCTNHTKVGMQQFRARRNTDSFRNKRSITLKLLRSCPGCPCQSFPSARDATRPFSDENCEEFNAETWRLTRLEEFSSVIPACQGHPFGKSGNDKKLSQKHANQSF